LLLFISILPLATAQMSDTNPADDLYQPAYADVNLVRSLVREVAILRSEVHILTQQNATLIPLVEQVRSMQTNQAQIESFVAGISEAIADIRHNLIPQYHQKSTDQLNERIEHNKQFSYIMRTEVIIGLSALMIMLSCLFLIVVAKGNINLKKKRKADQTLDNAMRYSKTKRKKKVK